MTTIVSSLNTNLGIYYYQNNVFNIFKAGCFKLNGIKFTVNASDSLSQIILKINDKKQLTGVKAILAQKIDGSLKLLLQASSLKTMIHIQDYNKVLFDLYKKKLLGTHDEALVQAVDSAGKGHNVTLRYESVHKSYRQTPLISENNKFELAIQSSNNPNVLGNLSIINDENHNNNPLDNIDDNDYDISSLFNNNSVSNLHTTNSNSDLSGNHGISASDNSSTQVTVISKSIAEDIAKELIRELKQKEDVYYNSLSDQQQKERNKRISPDARYKDLNVVLSKFLENKFYKRKPQNLLSKKQELITEILSTIGISKPNPFEWNMHNSIKFIPNKRGIIFASNSKIQSKNIQNILGPIIDKVLNNG